MVDASPTAMLVEELVRDHAELESRIDAVIMLIAGWQADGASVRSEKILEDICRLLKGGLRVPESTEDL
jgi:hypothetical protein